MRVWLIKDGEHLPVQGDVRPMRTWMIAASLRERGHTVVWWSSTFSHQSKALLAQRDNDIEIESRFNLRMLHAGSYRHNVSVQRLWHHRTLANVFSEQASSAPRPDAIVCALPTLQLVSAAVQMARARDVPLFIDVRDLWPDAFINLAPNAIRGATRLLARPWFRQVGGLLAQADGLIAVSPGYLDWALRLAARDRGKSDAVFPLGTTPPLIDPVASRKAHDDALPVTFIFVGSFGRSYNLQLVCDVAARLAHEGAVDIRFDLVGAGDQYEAIRQRVCALPNVALHGWVGQSRVSQLLAAADVGLVPCTSVRDTMNNKIYEYLSMGLPQLCSLEGDARRLIEESDVGMYYRDGSREELYEAVIKLARDHALRERQSDNALSLYRERFDARQIYPNYAEHLERAVAVLQHD